MSAQPQAPVDLDYINDMLGDDRAFIREFFGTFLSDISTRLPKLEESMKFFDGRKVRDIAHSFAGSANCLGAEELRRRTLELEEAALAGGVETTRRAYREFQTELVRVEEFLKRHLEREQ